MVPKGPHGPKRILNGQKHLGLQLRTLLDLFGMLTSLTCLAIFVCFIGVFWDTLYYDCLGYVVSMLIRVMVMKMMAAVVLAFNGRTHGGRSLQVKLN